MSDSLSEIIPSFSKAQLYIFDLDGTLYDQKKIRIKIFLKLIWKLLTLQLSLFDIKILSAFRREREKHKGYASAYLNNEQYQWCAVQLNISTAKVQKCIEKWMYSFPLKILNSAKYPGVDEFFSFLADNQKKIVIYSDYPVMDKMEALELSANYYFCSTDSSLNQLKPSKSGLNVICSAMNCSAKETIYIGDREDTDGTGARSAGIPFILVDTEKARSGMFYKELLTQIKQQNGQ